ncbi:unnamed protein product, partial [Scytosiphon promiscuus]
AGLGQQGGDGASASGGVSAPDVHHGEITAYSGSDVSDGESRSDPNEAFSRLENAGEPDHRDKEQEEGSEEEEEEREEVGGRDKGSFPSPPKPRITRNKAKDKPGSTLPPSDDVWEFLGTVKKWKGTEKCKGFRLVAPEEGSKPMGEDELLTHVASH